MPTSPTDRRCGRCGKMVVPVFSLRTDKHYADERCPSCNFFMGFVQKPDQDKSRRPAAHRDLVKKFGGGFCEFCSLTKDELPPGDTLEGHHIEEYTDGGEPTAENVLTICTHCHLLLHFQRDHYAKTIREVRAKAVSP